MYPLAAPAAGPVLGFGGESPLPVLTVWGLLTGGGFLVLLGTGLLAWWLDRRSEARRGTADLGVFVHRERPEHVGRRINGAEVADAGRELAALRAAARSAGAMAEQARLRSEQAERALDSAELNYDVARRAYQTSRASRPGPTSGADTEMERDVTQAALNAYRRGDLSAEELRRVWYGASGWDAQQDAAEQEILCRHAEELAARQEYREALAAAQAARRAEYVADIAVRALQTEATRAAAELAAAELAVARSRRAGRHGRSGRAR